MANFPQVIFTQDGLSMLMQAEGKNTNLIFTCVKLGDGQLEVGQEQEKLKELVSPKLTLPIGGIDKTVAGQITIETTVNNSDVDSGFFARELGIFAKINEQGQEKLYAYTNAANLADYITDKTVPISEDVIRITLAVGNASNVSIEIGKSIVYQTVKQSNIDIAAAVDKHNKDKNAHETIVTDLKNQIASGINTHDSNPNAHKKLMQGLQNKIDSIDFTPYATKAGVKSDISTHNSAPDAHNDIRQLIASVSGNIDFSPYAKKTELTSAISNHNSDGNAHSSIFANINSTIQSHWNATATYGDVDNRIASHNSNSAAHSDIRSSIINTAASAVSNHNSDINAHSNIITSINNTIQNHWNATATYTDVDNKIASHNSSSTAHNDIRQLIASVSGNIDFSPYATKAGVKSDISTHNSAPDAHSDIRQLIDTKIDAIDLSPYAKTTAVTQDIATHNSDSNAHYDIIAGIKSTVRNNWIQTATHNYVDSMIASHNITPDAHNDIRQLITNKIDATALLPYAKTTQVTQDISAHNSDSNAHNDIRQLIDGLKSPVFTSIMDNSRCDGYTRNSNTSYMVGATMGGDIYLTQTYQNFDYLVIINSDDSINAVGASMIPVQTFDFLMNNVRIVSITNLYNWYIWSCMSGNSTATHWAIQSENSGIVDIIGIKY